MNTKIKIQHYVPRLYLNNFVIKPKKHSVYCYDKTKSKAFIVNTQNVACESYFYDMYREEEQKIEKALNQIESSFDPIYKKMLNSRDLTSLTSIEKQTIAFFVATQELRTREHRELMKDMWKQAKDRLYKEELTEEFKERYGIDTWGTEDGTKALQLSMFRNIPYYAEILLQMKWILLINLAPTPFWTSDHPINRFNPIDMKPYGNLGLRSRGIQIHYPLSPKIVLSFSDPSTYEFYGESIEVKDIQNVIFENSLQVTHSTRYIFSKFNDFSLAKSILQDNPALGDISRKRIQVK
ncbi:DUF4238 domain-containing protein [Chloroflexota bacterium]